jgi:aspartate kinase
VKIWVQKFGGTSVDTDEHRLTAAKRVLARLQDGYAVVVVVSAIGRAGAPYATDTLAAELEAIDPMIPPRPREKDLMISCGEIISTVKMSHTLHTLGVDAVSLTGGQAGIVTDYEFGNARILSIDPGYIVYSLEQKKTVVVTGFQGVTERPSPRMHGAITTLGRGGSDTTASALGVALGAEAVEIFTDVDGVKTADPKLIPEARTLETVSYQEVAEMAHQGARVVHPRAAELAMNHSIPLWVRSTFVDKPGTLVRIPPSVPLPRTVDDLAVTAVTDSSDVVYVTFWMERTEDRAVIEQEIYRLMANAGINFYLLSFGRQSLAFAMERRFLRTLTELLDALVIPVVEGGPAAGSRSAAGRLYLFRVEGHLRTFQLQQELLSRTAPHFLIETVPVHIEENCRIVSIVAPRHRYVPGVMARVADLLGDADVTIEQAANSDMSVSCLVHESDTQRAVRALHDGFRLVLPPEQRFASPQ